MTTAEKDKALAEWLARRMEQFQLTQAEVAERCGVDKSTVSRWLAGERTPHWPYVARLVPWFGYPPITPDSRG